VLRFMPPITRAQRGTSVGIRARWVGSGIFDRLSGGNHTGIKTRVGPHQVGERDTVKKGEASQRFVIARLMFPHGGAVGFGGLGGSSPNTAARALCCLQFERLEFFLFLFRRQRVVVLDAGLFFGGGWLMARSCRPLWWARRLFASLAARR